MQIEIHLRDGRTSFRFKNRALLGAAIKNKPDHEGPRIIAEIKRNRDDEEWLKISVRSIAAGSISYAVEVPKEDDTVQGGIEEPAPA